MKTIEERTFTTAQIARIIGKTLPKTIAYIDRGFIKPSIRDASGHGSRREWSYLDVVRMCLIERLEEMGVNVAKMREIGPALTKERMAKHKLMVVHGGRPEDIVDFVGNLDQQDPGTVSNVPSIPHGVSAEAIEFDRSPVKVVVSMGSLHRWAQERIAKLDSCE